MHIDTLTRESRTLLHFSVSYDSIKLHSLLISARYGDLVFLPHISIVHPDKQHCGSAIHAIPNELHNESSRMKTFLDDNLRAAY